MVVTSARGYDPSTGSGRTFHDRVPGFFEGTDSPRAFLEECLATIDEREADVRAWVALRVDGARAEGDAATRRYRSGRPLSSIDGLPIGIKDVLETKDLPTAHGFVPFAGRETFRDSAAVRALRDAGAIVLGKTVTTELAAGDPVVTTNPYDAERTPGGSSSGSAAAVAAGMVPAALGTQVGGSVIRPAGFCGTFAIKPTLGAINRGEYTHLSQDHIGVFAASLADLWNVTTEVACRAGGDPGSPGLFAAHDTGEAAAPRRLVVMETAGWEMLHPGSRKAFETFLAELTNLGIEIQRRADDQLVDAFETAIADASGITGRILAYESRWLLEDLDERYPGALSPSNRRQLDRGRTLTLDDYRIALAQRDHARRALAELAPLADALISVATTGPAPPRTGDRVGDHVFNTGNPVFNLPTSILGAPALAMPILAVDGLPVGIQLIGQWHAEARVVAFGRWITAQVAPARA